MGTLRAADRRRLAVGALASAALLLGGCLPGGDDPTPPPSGADGTAAGTGEDGGLVEINRPDQRHLTFDEVSKALPDAEDAPPGFRTGEYPSGWGDVVTDPAECADLWVNSEAVVAFRRDANMTFARTAYLRPKAEGGGRLSVRLATFGRPFPTSFLDDAGRAMGSCEEFTFDPTGEAETYQASLIEVPNLGDQAFARRITYPDGGTQDAVFVVSGHNVVEIFLSDTTVPYESEPLAGLAETVLDNLDQ